MQKPPDCALVAFFMPERIELRLGGCNAHGALARENPPKC